MVKSKFEMPAAVDKNNLPSGIELKSGRRTASVRQLLQIMQQLRQTAKSTRWSGSSLKLSKNEAA